MGLAPTPGVGRRAEESTAAQQILRITLRGESHTLALNNIPLKERLIVRKATGLPLEAFVGEVEDEGANKLGLDTLIVLWWLARRANGEWQLTFTRAGEEWPADLDVEGDLDVTLVEPDDEASDPEA